MKLSRVFTTTPAGRVQSCSTDTFLGWCAEQTRESGIAVDTETQGLGWYDLTRLVQFGHTYQGFAVDTACPEGQEIVREAIEHAYNGPLIFHNAGFDIRHLMELGLDPERLWPRAIDTFTLAHVVKSDRLSFKLADLVRTELDVTVTDWKVVFRRLIKKHGWDYSTVPRLLLVPYGITDAMLTHELYHHLARSITPTMWDVVQKEMDTAWAVWMVHMHGMRLDRQYAFVLNERWKEEIDVLKAQMATYPLEVRLCPRCKGRGTTPTGKRACSLCSGVGHAGQEYLDNPNADAQIARALRLEGWTPTELTGKAEKPKLDKKVLKSLRNDYPLIEFLMEYKRLNKWRAAYIVNCLEQVDNDDRVHASYNALGAKTGRMSCSNPPLQQLPKGGGGEVRRMFIASPGNVIASVDYSAIEMRLAGALANEPRILEVYAKGMDIYQQFADELGITRPEAKIFSLATMYGATANKHAQVFGWTVYRARKVVKDFWAQYPALAKWNDELIAQARAGVDTISRWGRPLRPHAAYAAPNAVIQGTAAEVMKDGIARLWAEGLLKYVVAIVHDEVVLDVPTGIAAEVAERVAQVLEDRRFKCPLLAEASVYGHSWGDGYAVAA